MIFYTTTTGFLSFLALPLLLLLWSLDTYLLLAAIRLLLGQSATVRSNTLYASLQRLTDPLPQAVGQWITRHRHRDHPVWLQWAAVLLAIVFIKYLLAGVLLSIA